MSCEQKAYNKKKKIVVFRKLVTSRLIVIDKSALQNIQRPAVIRF